MARQVCRGAPSPSFSVSLPTPLTRAPQGYESRYSKDIRVAPVSNDFSVVYWSGEGAQATPIWSFHIARRRPDIRLHAVAKPHAFDERRDAPVDLAAARLRVLVYCELDEAVSLSGGILIAPEESIVWLEHSPVGGPREVVPVTLPLVGPKPDFGGVVLT